MHGVGALVGGLLCKLVPGACAAVVLVVHIRLHSRLSSAADNVL